MTTVIGMHEQYALVPPLEFVSAMNDHWTQTLNMPSSAALRSLSISIEPGPQIGAEKGPLFRRAFCAVVGVTEGGRSPTGVTPTTAAA